MAIQKDRTQEKTLFLSGLKAGVIADIRINKMISVQPGLFYQKKGYKAITPATFTTNNIELPINFQFRFPLGSGYFFAGAGPYASYVLNGKYETGNNTSSETAVKRDILTGAGAGDDVRPLDMGLNLNTGYMLSKGLFFRANTGFGISNLQPKGTSVNSTRNFSVALTLGWLPG